MSSGRLRRTVRRSPLARPTAAAASGPRWPPSRSCRHRADRPGQHLLVHIEVGPRLRDLGGDHHQRGPALRRLGDAGHGVGEPTPLMDTQRRHLTAHPTIGIGHGGGAALDGRRRRRPRRRSWRWSHGSCPSPPPRSLPHTAPDEVLTNGLGDFHRGDDESEHPHRRPRPGDDLQRSGDHHRTGGR